MDGQWPTSPGELNKQSVKQHKARWFGEDHEKRPRDQSGDHMQALANYQRSLGENRFQPEVAARVAQLQGVAATAGIPAAGAPATETRTANGSQPPTRY